MSRIEMTKCDHCDKRVDNYAAERGWIKITGPGESSLSIARYTGEYKNGCYQSDYLKCVREFDFCCLVCLVAALDQQAHQRADKEAAEKEKRPS